MDPLDYIHSESKRQSATVKEMAGMCEAYDWMLNFSELSQPLSETVVCILSDKITRRHHYRRVPAVFNQGVPAVNAQNIPRMMKNWFEVVSEGPRVSWFVDDVIKEFLLIHPFADGNGRVASLLWNYLNGTLADPKPLPYFFGEN